MQLRRIKLPNQSIFKTILLLLLNYSMVKNNLLKKMALASALTASSAANAGLITETCNMGYDNNGQYESCMNYNSNTNKLTFDLEILDPELTLANTLLLDLNGTGTLYGNIDSGDFTNYGTSDSYQEVLGGLQILGYNFDSNSTMNFELGLTNDLSFGDEIDYSIGTNWKGGALDFSGTGVYTDQNTSVVSEPKTAVMFALGLAGLLGLSRRQKKTLV